MNLVYKVCSKDEWDQATINQFYSGSDVDNKDGFIHLSTKKQLHDNAKDVGLKCLEILSFGKCFLIIFKNFLLPLPVILVAKGKISFFTTS